MVEDDFDVHLVAFPFNNEFGSFEDFLDFVFEGGFSVGGLINPLLD